MKKLVFLYLVTFFPAALAAQTPAVAQLGAVSALKTADLAVPAPGAPEAVPAGKVLMLLDTASGKVEAVIPVGGGFIYAASGRFVPAVFNGSGYILQTGQYLPVVGGGRAKPDGLSGKWLGQGEWTYQGSGAHCYMNLEFEDTRDYLLRKGGYFDCGFVGLASEPAKFLKSGTQLLTEDGQPAGSYEGGVIKLNEAYSENVGIVTTIKVDGLHFDYSEIWTEKSGKELYVITGRLFTGG